MADESKMKFESKSHILLVSNFLSKSGGSRSIAEEFAEQLTHAGYTLFTTSGIRLRFFRLIDMLWTTFSRRRSYQAAYIEVYSGAAFLWAEMVCALLNVLQKPYILALHGGDLPVFANHSPKRIKYLFEGAKKIIAPSRYLQEKMKFYRTDIDLIPNPLDLEKYLFHIRSKPRPHLVWLRAFHNIYNPQMTPKVIEYLRVSFPDISLTMIGPDKGDGALQETLAEIERLGVQKNIKIIPGIPKKEVPERLSKFDVFINTTNADNTPVSVLEALACGLCVVSTNVGGIPYLLQDGVDALLVPPDDPQAMAESILHLLREPELAEHLSRNARKKAEQFDWSVILPQLEALFSEVINRHQSWQS